MLARADERTLAEDWLVRRQRLAASQTVPEQHRRMQLQVLDYLIRRYGDSAEAARPARFASMAEFYSNDRAIVVHQHLGRGKIAGVKSQVEANRRVGDILKHLQSVHGDDSNASPAHNDFANWVDELDRRPPIPEEAWRSMWRTLRRGWQAHWTIAEALKESPYLPRAALVYLCRCLSNTKQVDIRAAELLIQCRTETAPHYAASAWRKRVVSRCDDAVTRILRAFLVLSGRCRTQFANNWRPRTSKPVWRRSMCCARRAVWTMCRSCPTWPRCRSQSMTILANAPNCWTRCGRLHIGNNLQPVE